MSVYSALKVTYSCRQVAEEDLGLAALAGQRRARTPPRRAPHGLLELAQLVVRQRDASPARHHLRPSISRSTTNAVAGRPGLRRPPAGCGRSWGRRRAARSSRAASWRPRARRGSTASRAPRTTIRADPLRALAVGHDLERELAQQRVHRLAERAARRRSPGSTRTPDAPLASTNTVSLVDSWPSTEMRSNERLTHHAGEQLERLGRRARRRSARSRTSWRSAARSCPRPSPARDRRTVPPASSTSRHARLGQRSVVMIACAEVARRRRRAPDRRARARPRAAARAAARGRSRRSRPRPPARARRPSSSAARAPAWRSAVSMPRCAVAGVRAAGVGHDGAQPVERRPAARRSPARPRRALRGEARRRDGRPARPTRARPRRGPVGFSPAATPAARKPAGQRARVELRSRARAARPSASGRSRHAHAAPPSRRRPEHQVEVLHRLAGGALPEVVDRGERQHAPGRRLDRRVDAADVGVAHVAHAGRRVGQLDERLAARRRRAKSSRSSSARSAARARRHVAAGEQPLVERHAGAG